MGPSTVDSATVVKLVTRQSGLPHLSYSTTASSLTPDPYVVPSARDRAAQQPFFRLSYNDEQMVGAMWGFLLGQGWNKVTVLHSRDETGQSSLRLLRQLVQAQRYKNVEIAGATDFVGGDQASVDAALKQLAHHQARVVVLFASAPHAALVMRRAFDYGLTGKGWTWVGNEWVREYTWQTAAGLTVAHDPSVPLPVEDIDQAGGGGDLRRRRLGAPAVRSDSLGAGAVEAVVETEPSGVFSALASLARGFGRSLSRVTAPAPLLSTFTRRSEGKRAVVQAMAHLSRKLSGGGAAKAPLVMPATNNGNNYPADLWVPGLVRGPNTPAGHVAAVRTAMQGAIGIVPPLIPPDTVLGGLLDKLTLDTVSNPAIYHLSAPYGLFPAPEALSAANCPVFFEAPLKDQGVRLGQFAPYVFDAVWTLATAIEQAVVWDGIPLGKLTPANISAALARGGARQSPLTKTTVDFLSNGDRLNVPLALVNVQANKVVQISQWVPTVNAAPAPVLVLNPDGTTRVDPNQNGLLSNGSRLSDGFWNPFKHESIVWSSGTGSVGEPTDRVLESSHAGATALVAALLGITVSLLVGSILHHAHIELLPESGSTVLIGCAFGVLLRFMFGADVRATAEFDSHFFMLVFLPIIIAASGYANFDKRSFFQYLFSISTFAIAGTVISAFVFGFVIYVASYSGSIPAITYEESMAYASLMSATDPVATLAVFSSLKVEPALNAYVLGESIINDAVALVLFRTFSGFLVNDITLNAAFLAVGEFTGTIVFSVIIGVIVSMFATLTFRYVNVGGLFRSIGWEKDLQSKLKMIKKMMPTIKVAGVDLSGGDAENHTGDDHDELHAQKEKAKAEAIKSSHDAHYSRKKTTHTAAGVDLSAGVAEAMILLLFTYISFCLAEAAGLSGIVAVLVTSIGMNHYTRRVLSRDGKVTSVAVFRMLSTLADTSVFFQIGLNVILNLGVGNAFDMNFTVVSLIACLVSRAANIFPLSYLLNLKREVPIPMNTQIAMWYAGLRGVIAYATALGFPSHHRDLILNTTSWICLFTIFAMGGTTTRMLRALRIPFGIEQSREEKVALASKSRHESKVKAAMVFVDMWIQRVIYGELFLNEMEEVNKKANEDVVRTMAARLGLSEEQTKGLKPHDDAFGTPTHEGLRSRTWSMEGIESGSDTDGEGHGSRRASRRHLLPKRAGVYASDWFQTAGRHTDPEFEAKLVAKFGRAAVDSANASLTSEQRAVENLVSYRKPREHHNERLQAHVTHQTLSMAAFILHEEAKQGHEHVPGAAASSVAATVAMAVPASAVSASSATPASSDAHAADSWDTAMAAQSSGESRRGRPESHSMEDVLQTSFIGEDEHHTSSRTNASPLVVPSSPIESPLNLSAAEIAATVTLPGSPHA
jgi:NhaP-type Na+/H+ or K+/H+ antiporter